VKWRYAVLGLLGTVLLTSASLAALALWIVRTEDGTRWVLERLTDRAGPVLGFAYVSGTFEDGVTIADLAIDLPDARILIDRVTIRMSLSELLLRRVLLEEVAAGNVAYAQRDDVAERADGAAGAGFSSPLEVELGLVSIESIRVTMPDFEALFAETSFAGSLIGGTVRVTDFATTTRDVVLNGNADIAVSGEPSATAELAWSTAIDGIVWSGAGRVSGSVAEVTFEHRLDAPVAVSANGRITLGDEIDGEASIEWTDLYWPGEDRLTSPAGSLQVSGWIESFEFAGAGSLLVQDIAVDFVASGEATPDTVALGSAALQTDFGAVGLAGTVSLAGRSIELQFDARDLDPGRFFPEWPARINARGGLEGSLEPTLRWALSDLALEGTVRNEAVAMRGNVSSPAPDEWQLDQVAIDWGGNRGSLSGSVGQSLDLVLSFDAPRLQAFPGGIGGRASLDGAVSGTRESPAFSGTLEADSLATRGFVLDRLVAEGSVAAAQEALVEVSFSASGLRREQVIADTISGRFEGTTAAHMLAVDVAHRLGTGAVRGSGSWTGTLWEGEIESVDINQDLLGIWSLEEPAGITASAESLAVDMLCLRNAGARLCAGAELGIPNERVAASLESFDLASLQPLLGDTASIRGLYSGELLLLGPRDRPTGTLSVTGESTMISVSDVEAPLEIPVDRIVVDASLTGTELEVLAELSAPAGARVELAAEVTDIWTAQPLIDASIDGSWTDPQFISVLSPEVGDVSGALTVAVEIYGPLESPEARGEARWVDGEIEVPRWGLVIRDIDALISSPAGNEFVYAISGTSGDGSLQVTGRTELDPAAAWPTSFRLRGENLAAIQLPEAQAVVSPDLEVVTDWPTVFVSGEVRIPSADLNLDQVAAQSATVSPDVVVHGVGAPPPQRPLDVRANLRLILGDDVRLRGSGLDATLGGGIDIDYSSGQEAVASGTMALAGQFTTLGQTMELDRGRLMFTGPVTNPGIDVRAVRRFESLSGDVLAGVLVTGTVREPETRLFSEPSMSEGDIVSYLVIGRPISESSRENSEALETAALSLGLTQALPQIRHFGEAIGLDELGLRTSAANTGELMAGKQISPRIYVRYTYGLVNRIGGLLLRFKLTDQIRLETRTGELKAMDLLYTVERE
jgi:translocation and assembly module TamB